MRHDELNRQRVAAQEVEQFGQFLARWTRDAAIFQDLSGQFQRIQSTEAGQFGVGGYYAGLEVGVGEGGVAGGNDEG